MTFYAEELRCVSETSCYVIANRLLRKAYAVQTVESRQVDREGGFNFTRVEQPAINLLVVFLSREVASEKPGNRLIVTGFMQYA